MMIDDNKTLKIVVNDLQPGMYVSNLDRPWLGTPYFIQGILIQSRDDINELARHCSYVYVDVDKSEPFVIPQRIPSDPSHTSQNSSTTSKKRDTKTSEKLARETEEAPNTSQGGSALSKMQDPEVSKKLVRQVKAAEALETSSHTSQGGSALSKMQNIEALRKLAQEMDATETIKTPFHGKSKYIDTHTVEEELPEAIQAFDMASTLLGEVNLGIERSTKLDVRAAKETVNALRDSVVRNPNAVLLLARLRTTGKVLYDNAVKISVHLLALGRHLGLPQKELSSLGLGGLLMDIGKLHLPLEIQAKSNLLLVPAERKLMQQHVNYGEEAVAQSSDIPEEVLQIVAQHHERENGCGYPRGLYANQLHTFSRMAAIVDCYEELIIARPNLPALKPCQALKELRDDAYSGLNSVLVEQFAHCVGIFPVGSLVELNTGEVAIVLTHNRTQRFLPSIMIIFDAQKRPYDTPLTVDLKSTVPGPSGIQYSITSDLPQGAYGIDAKQYYL